MVAEGHRPTAVPGGERRREALEVGVERERGEERGRSPAGPRERGGRTRLLFGKELEGAAVETPEEGLVELGFGPARPGLGCQLG
jgi:hypothetical protein